MTGPSSGAAQPDPDNPAGQPPRYPQPDAGMPPQQQHAAGDINVIGPRVGQWILDYLLVLIVPVVLILLLGGGGGATFLGYVLIAVIGFFEYAYWIYTHDGQSPAMAWLGLRVVMADGSPLTLQACTVRWLLFIADAFFAGLVGLIVMLASDKNQRVGDMAAGTLVVRA